MSPPRRLRFAAAIVAAAAGLAAAWLATAAAGPSHAPTPPGTDTTAAGATLADSSRRAWTEARGLADDGRHDEALAVVRRALLRDPDNVDLRWLEAGITGWSGRHAEAVRLYERLVADHPELARDVRGDLAGERLEAGDTRGALRDLELRIAEEPSDREARSRRARALSYADRLPESLAAYDALLEDDPQDTDAMLERARVLAWMGRNRAAAAAYRAVLERRPDDQRARLGLATNENWQGLHRRAAASLESLAVERPADPEAMKALAFARYWSGDPARARASLDAYLEREPQDREALDLARRVARELSPSLTAGTARSDDSDGLRVVSTSMELRVPFAGRSWATFGWQRDNVRDADGTRDPLVLRAGVETRWSGAWSSRATFGFCDLGDSAGTTSLGELAVTVRPEDRWRIDVGVSRDLIVTRRSLARGVSARTWTGGADWKPQERITLRASDRLRFYSDDNRSQNEAASVDARVFSSRKGSATITARGEQLRTRLDLNDGYYDPRMYREGGPGLGLEWTPREDVTVTGNGILGWQWERGGETQPFFNVAGRAEWTIQRLLTLAIEGGRSNSNLTAASGYERTHWAVSATRGF